MLAALLLNPVEAFPAAKPRPAIKVKYIWPPLDYEADVDKEITRQEEITRKKPTRAKAEKVVEAVLARDLAEIENIPEADALELISRRKAEHLAQMARQAIEDDDEEALGLIFLMME